MRRVRDERGAVAVVVAFLMVPLLGFAALSIDVAGMWWEKQQLHTGADAAALAIAQACGRGACGTPSSTAQQLATDNHPGGGATGSVVSLSTSAVRVRTTANRTHLLGPVLGSRSAAVSAEATAAWGAPNGGTAVLPLTFSWCEWQLQTVGGLLSGSVARTIYLTRTLGATSCVGPSSGIVPGGFGWLSVSSGSCGTRTAIGDTVVTDPGNSVPSSCSTSDLTAVQNKTVLLPVFDASAGTGSGVTYHLYGYAAFTLTGYSFGGQYSWNSPCNGNARCIRGYFTRLVSLTEAFTYAAGAPALGASVVSLTS